MNPGTDNEKRRREGVRNAAGKLRVLLGFVVGGGVLSLQLSCADAVRGRQLPSGNFALKFGKSLKGDRKG